jgi:hypothetical protein
MELSMDNEIATYRMTGTTSRMQYKGFTFFIEDCEDGSDENNPKTNIKIYREFFVVDDLTGEYFRPRLQIFEGQHFEVMAEARSFLTNVVDNHKES